MSDFKKEHSMKKHLIYDFPTRIFHWLFAILFLIAFVIGKTFDDESPLYSYHMLAGLTLGFSVFLRLLWGVVGTKHAKLTEWPLRPTRLLSYLKGVLTGDKQKWPSHNPASSWAALLMFLATIGLGTTGLSMTSGGNREEFKEVHELFANAFLILVLFHIAGVVVHTLRHRDPIGLSMIDGMKSDISPDSTISSAKPLAGAVFLVCVVFFGSYLFRGYNPELQQLHFFGKTLALSDSEEENEIKHEYKESTESNDEDFQENEELKQ